MAIAECGALCDCTSQMPMKTALLTEQESNHNLFNQCYNEVHLISPFEIRIFIKKQTALAGVVQWVEHPLVNQWVPSSIPSQGTCLGCRSIPHLGCMKGNHTLSLPLCLPPFPAV